MGKAVALSIKKINKSFPGVKALNDVSIEILSGEVHALVGENGAGKSTLMNILGGIIRKDSGDILIKNEKVEFNSPYDSIQKGISIVHQELGLVLPLTVAENIFIGRLKTNQMGKINWQEINNDASELLKRIGLDINPKTMVQDLSIAEMQMVEILKAISYDPDILIMDEPSSTLTEKEMGYLYKIINAFKSQGKTIIYISHRLEEIFTICDRITVLRDGMYVGTKETRETNRDELVEMMVGRSVNTEFSKRYSQIGEEVLKVVGVCRGDILKDICFTLKKGEVLGIAGLVGAGRTELVRAIFGADQKDCGEVIIKGLKTKIKAPSDSIKNGIALLTEDRKLHGLVLKSSIRNNITLANLKKILQNGLLKTRLEKKESIKYINALKIKTPSEKQLALNLSGGNQQKVVLAKWLFCESDILILDEPTRGIDVGAKYDIYELINQLTQEGKSIILISSELSEVIAMSDRVLVMKNGELVAELNREETTPEKVMQYAMG